MSGAAEVHEAGIVLAEGGALARWAAALVAGRPPGRLSVGPAEAVATFLGRRGLAGLARTAVERGSATVDEDTARALAGPAAVASIRGSEALDAAGRVRAALAADGVETLLFKGAAIVKAGLRTVTERAFSDVDVLLRPEDEGRAIAVLQGEGLVPWVPWDERRLEWLSAFTLDLPGVSEELAVTFDVHWSTRCADLRHRRHDTPDPLWSGYDRERGVPGAEGNFAMIADHILKHLHVTVHLSGFADLVRLLPEVLDPDALGRHAAGRCLGRRLPRLLDVLEQSFGVPRDAFGVLPPELRPTGRPIPASLALERLLQRGTSPTSDRGGGLRLRWAMGSSAVHDVSDVLLPDSRWLRARYPTIGTGPGRRLEHLRRVALWLTRGAPSPVSPNQDLE